jgi:Ca2+/Na+ antiporter
VDPWYDYLAIPVAPLVLVVQFAALFLRRRWVRIGFAVGCPTAITAMLLFVASRPDPEEGANIGAGVLGLWLAVSAILLMLGLVREGAALLTGRGKPAA